ncbi:hypothetical protein V8F20_006420 [Naviculisporaceae sp. PSN 640]
MEKPNNPAIPPIVDSDVVPPPSNALVQDLIHGRAVLHPDAEAVCSHDCTLTYHALDTASFQLAQRLVEDGVGPEVIVPLLFEKSGWALVAMLAVLKAGGAFMPLDISQPEKRLRSIVEQTGATVALSSASCHALSSSLVKKSVIVTVEETITSTNTPRTISTTPAPHSHNAAYVMATSGSTGTPKLVITEHAQLSSFVAYLTKPLNFTDKTRAFQFASYAFDPIIGDIFLTLCAGGTVCIPSEDERRNDIVGAMQSMRVTLAKFTPSLVHSLLDTLTPESVPLLETLVLGGETASRDVTRAWADKVDLKLIYGSTECTISCVVEHASLHDTSPGEIGRPFGSLAWVVNPECREDLDLVDDGQVGELVLEGPLVSREYMNNPSQTAAKYITRTEGSASKSSRMYRTGDLVRRLVDGRLVYVGRVDNQVKIRGQRLELEEVEQHVLKALCNLSGSIRTKSVLVDYVAPAGETAKQLVGILSLESSNPVVGLGSLVLTGADPDATVMITESSQHEFGLIVAQLEEILKVMIPSYMVPTLWIPIEDMPFTLSRKRDRQRLRRAVESLPVSTLASLYRAKRMHAVNGVHVVLSGKQRLLQDAWSKVLEIRPEEIGLADDFFYVGGTSLSVLRLVSMLRKTGYHLTADAVFRYPKLGHLASRLTLVKSSSARVPPFGLIDTSSLARIRTEAAQQCNVEENALEDILPLYSMQYHYITGYPELGRNINGPWAWQQQVVFSLPPGLDIRRFQSVWSGLVNDHAQLRTRVVNTSHGLFQVVLSPNFSLRWREADNLDTYVQRDRTVMTFGDELLRLGMVRSGGDSFFILTMHHLIYDAYSRDLLFKLLESRYQEQAPLPNDRQQTNMTQFIRYVTGDAIRQSAVKFWTSYLEGAGMKPFLSKPLGSRPVGDLQSEKLTLPKPEIPSSSGFTLSTVIEVSAALAIAHLQCREAQDAGDSDSKAPPKDILFYSDRAGRNLPVEGISDLIAPTTLFLPLRVPINRSQPIRELLSTHQTASKEMILHEHMNWTELRETSHLKDVLKHSVNININPYMPLGKLGKGMGLQVVDEHETCDDPFGINVSVGDEELEWVLYFDKEFISRDKVQRLKGMVRKIFDLVVLNCSALDDSGGLTLVGDVL